MKTRTKARCRVCGEEVLNEPAMDGWGWYDPCYCSVGCLLRGTSDSRVRVRVKRPREA